jgi:hypothetical protein
MTTRVGSIDLIRPAASWPGAFMPGSCVGNREVCADRQRGELIEPAVAAGAPVATSSCRTARACAAPFAGYRPDHRAEVEFAQSTRIVQRKRRPTSNVGSMMVLGARRGRTGSKSVTFRGGLRRAIPFVLVKSACGARGPLFYADKRSCCIRIAWRKAGSSGKDYESAADRRVGKSRSDSLTHVAQKEWYTGNSGCSCSTGFENEASLSRVYSRPIGSEGRFPRPLIA